MDAKTLKTQLQAPFDEYDYEWRVQSESKKGDKVNVLCYVTARAIQNRLDDVCGPFGWKVSYTKGPDSGVVCQLSIKSEDGEWITKEDGAANTNIEAVEGGISSALKRAGCVWGIGRLLYRLDNTWVALKQKGQNYYLTKNKSVLFWDNPRLPDWAVAKKDIKRGAKKKTQISSPTPPSQQTAQPPKEETPNEKKKFWQAIQAIMTMNNIAIPTKKENICRMIAHILSALTQHDPLVCSTMLDKEAGIGDSDELWARATAVAANNNKTVTAAISSIYSDGW